MKCIKKKQSRKKTNISVYEIENAFNNYRVFVAS